MIQLLGDCRQCEVFHRQIFMYFFLSVTLFCGPATMSYLYHLLKVVIVFRVICKVSNIR